MNLYFRKVGGMVVLHRRDFPITLPERSCDVFDAKDAELDEQWHKYPRRTLCWSVRAFWKPMENSSRWALQ